MTSSRDEQGKLPGWGKVAAQGWFDRRDVLRRQMMPISEWMVDAVNPQPGQTVVELAAGVGDTGFLAAELVQPGGTLICSDSSPEMLTMAQERAKELRITNVRFRQINAESIDIPTASVDGVFCRWGYMLMADPDAALRETRRILKVGARVALAVWATRAENLWSTIPNDTLVRHGVREPSKPDEPGPFVWGEEGILQGYLDRAGFSDYEIETVDVNMSYASFDDFWETTNNLSRTFSDDLATLDSDLRSQVKSEIEEASQPFLQPDGKLRFPARVWVAAAS